MDRPALEWIAVELNAYPAEPVRDRLLAGIHQMLQLNDAQLTALAARPRNPLGTKAVPKVAIPYLSAKVESIGLLCSSRQKELVNLLHYVEVINIKVEELANWNRMTFEVTNDENHALISGNADVSIQAIITAAERTSVCIKNYLS